MATGTPLLAFVALGLPAGAIGVAWPYMRVSVGAPLAGLGLLIAGWTAAYFAVSAATGTLSTRLARPRLLTIACGLGAAGTLGFGAGTTWWMLGVASLAVGAGSGLIDATVNTQVSLTRGVRFMGWLHASWAVGAAVGPQAVVAALKLFSSWRPAFFAMAFVFTVTGLLIALTHHDWVAAEHRRTEPRQATYGRRGNQRLTVWLLIGVFLLGSGVEGTAGDWSFTHLTAGRLMTAGAAGVSVSLFWIGLAVGRIALGVLGDRVAPTRLLDISLAAVVLGALGFWLAPPIVAGFVALPVLGLAVSVIFPLLLSVTPARVGMTMTAHAVGYQLAAGTLGAGAFPAITGVVLQAAGLRALGPALTLLALGLFVLHIGSRSSDRPGG